MTQSINTSNAVIVVGDRDTAQRADLAEKAAEQGAVIAEIYTFELGEAASHHDLAEVEAVVAALSRAIGTRTDVWVPFPLQDLCREQHIRRLSLVLQRHGLNLLMGRELAPCPVEGGYNADRHGAAGRGPRCRRPRSRGDGRRRCTGAGR